MTRSKWLTIVLVANLVAIALAVVIMARAMIEDRGRMAGAALLVALFFAAETWAIVGADAEGRAS